MSKVKIQIKSLWGSILYENEKDDYTVKQALQDAVLQDADLRGAVLQDAVLRGAVLQDADLRGTVLRGAVLRGTVLRGTVLRGAKIENISDLGDFTNQCSRDMLFVFEHLKAELPFLRDKLVKGGVNGTQYEGDCACLIGTLANADGGIAKVCGAIPYYEKGLQNYCEQWFWQIREGDTPENNLYAAHALKLIDEVLAGV